MRCSSSRHWSIPVHQMRLYRCWEQAPCWETPYLNQLLFVISHKSPGAEIRNEEASCAEIAGLGLLQSCFFLYNESLIACNPVNMAPFPAGHLHSPLAAPNSLLLLCAQPPLRSEGYRQISRSLNGENVIQCTPKAFGELVLLSPPWSEWEIPVEAAVG